MIMIKLFFVFALIGIMTFGGGYSVLPLVDDLIVKRYGWLSAEEIADIISISEMSPGPFSLNCASFVGMRTAGLPGALLATAGFVVPSLVIVLILSYFYSKYHTISQVKLVFAVLNAGVVGVLIASAVNLLRSTVFLGTFADGNIDLPALLIFIAAFIAIYFFKTNPLLLIAASAVIGMVVYPHN